MPNPRPMGRRLAQTFARLARRPVPALLGVGAALSLLFLAAPGADLWASRLFYTPGLGFDLQGDGALQLVRRLSEFVTIGLIAASAAVLVLPLVRRIEDVRILRPHAAAYVFLLYLLGPALLVNGVLKEVFGRARPREIVEFGQSALFTPVWAVEGACQGNCSFVSGEGAAAAALLCLLPLVPKGYRLIAGLSLGTIAAALTLGRVAMGAHFLSDALLSWVVVALVAALLKPLLLDRGAEVDAAFQRWSDGFARKRAGGRGPASRALVAPPAPTMTAREGSPRRFALVSVVVPARNEADNLPILVGEIAGALAGRDHEILVVDDGSTDSTPETLAALRAAGLPVRHVRHDRSCGQSRAVRTGAAAALGDVTVTIDGDGQNDPRFIPVMLQRLEAGGAGLGLVAGQRTGRTDTALKRLSSAFANGLRASLLRDQTRDTGCGLKAIPTALLRQLPYFEGWHRYLPALVLREGCAVDHIDVVDRGRRFGWSNYGIFDRMMCGILDLAGVWWLLRRGRRRPAVTEV